MATSVFRGDQQMLSLFHAKQEIPTSLKSLATELTYTKDVATTYKDRLAKKGFKDADLTNIAALETELSGKDVTQEGSLRTGKGATKQRNDAIAVLKAMVEDVRISAALAFEEDESKLNEFKTLYPHRASKKKNGTKANAKNKPAASSANSTSETKQ